MVNSELKISHRVMVDQYIEDIKNNKNSSYMLTIARDGEDPVRTIIFYTNAIDAAEAYNKYTDWGFARNFLTVRLYEPNGVVNEKILKRNQAGECTFIRQDYISMQSILLKIKNNIDKNIYDSLCLDIMQIFAKDSWRFDPERFLKDLGIEYKLQS